MTKKEIPKSSDEDLLVDYVWSYGIFVRNMNLSMYKTKRIGQHVRDLEEEILKRKLLSQKAVDYLRR